jgi:hypothetical protein
MASYRSISYATFAKAMREIGFKEVSLPGTWEHVWEREILCRLSQGRYKVRILSSVDMQTGVTRDRAADAIHVLLLDTNRNDRVVLNLRVNRTERALTNTVKRAREAYGYVSAHPEHHCTCGSLMVVRQSKRGEFLGCTNYPECKETRRIAQAA